MGISNNDIMLSNQLYSCFDSDDSTQNPFDIDDINKISVLFRKHDFDNMFEIKPKGPPQKVIQNGQIYLTVEPSTFINIDQDAIINFKYDKSTYGYLIIDFPINEDLKEYLRDVTSKLNSSIDKYDTVYFKKKVSIIIEAINWKIEKLIFDYNIDYYFSPLKEKELKELRKMNFEYNKQGDMTNIKPGDNNYIFTYGTKYNDRRRNGNNHTISQYLKDRCLNNDKISAIIEKLGKIDKIIVNNNNTITRLPIFNKNLINLVIKYFDDFKYGKLQF